MTMRISKNRIDMDDKTLQKPVLKDYGETVVSANSSTSYTVDLHNGNVFDITMTGNCTFTFSNPPASGTAGSFTLLLTQDGTGSRTATWPSAVKWASGAAPTLTTTANYLDILTFVTINGGASWFGATAAQNYDGYLPYYLPYGYFGGGSGPLSTVDRIDYANDTAAAVAKGPLSLARYQYGATGNSSYGYFAGGFTFFSVSTTDRIDYANDTAAAVAKGPLSAARYGTIAAGTSNNGYVAGGALDAINSLSTTDRIDYANDTAAAVAKGPLSVARYSIGATGTSTYGYFSGGLQGFPSYSPVSTTDRIDYANDTPAAVAKGPLSSARNTLAAAGHSSYGYFGGGAPGPNSTIDRLDFANDTVTAVSKGPLSSARNGLAATGSATYGYFGGGAVPASTSLVDRIDYSNDTATASSVGPLSLARNLHAATQNSSL